jgi:spore coat protein CotH
MRRRWSRSVARAVVPALVVLVGCGGGGGGGSSSPTEPSATPLPTTGQAPSGAPIFDNRTLHDARLELDPGAWAALRQNYLSNQYYAANLTIDGVAVQQVGIRSRGEGSRSEDKPGLKVEFDKFVPGQEYYGYKSLVIDNLFQDASMLRERLSFLVFEAMGIAAPRNAFARLTVNGEYWGLYALVEPVSKPFLEARLGEKSGTLFDYEWVFPYDFSWLGSRASAYVPLPFQPETNESKPDVADGVVAFIQTVNEAPDDSFVQTIGSWLDVDRFLTYVAIENAIAEGDGMVGNQGANNFYLYEYGAKNRFVFIPWDKDTTFQSGTWPLYRNLDANVLTRRLTADPAKRQVYADAVLRAVTSCVNPRWLTPQLETAYQQIRSAVEEDLHKPYTNAEFEGAVSDLRGTIAERESDVRSQR